MRYSKIIAFVPYPVVKDGLVQHDGLGIRAKWISKIQEYDLEIRPIKVVKGRGLAKLLAEGNEESLDSHDQDSMSVNITLNIDEDHERYQDIIFYLKSLTCPPHLVDHQRRYLRLRLQNMF